MLEPRYGIWVPVGGNFGPLNTPDEPIDASYERTRSLVLEAIGEGCTDDKLLAKSGA
ncbi:MAG: hypothetical protein V7L00_29335 [Nostoc sp.]|uniref:hypothetical protein n=1 Tax=Nostoc sp. TaxID=1180 RepID=UPI002FF9F7A6